MESIPNNCEEKRVSVAQEILDFLSLLSERSVTIANNLDEKLSTVTTEAIPSPPEDVKPNVEREYPKLFVEMRTRLLNIQAAFDRIENTIERTEL